MLLASQRWLLPAILCLLARNAFAQSTVDACISANETAQRQLQQQSLIAARGSLEACLAPGCPEPIRADCSRMRAELDAAIPTLIVEVRNKRGDVVTNASLSIDGKTVPTSGNAIPLDPGPHSLLIEAPGYSSKNVEISLARGQRSFRQQVELDKKDPRAAYRGIGLVAGGFGALALGVGVYYGVRSKLTYDDAYEHCNGPRNCDDQGVSGGDDAHDQARTATTALILGTVFLAGGAYLYFTNRESEVAVGSSIGPRAVALDLRARW